MSHTTKPSASAVIPARIGAYPPYSRDCATSLLYHRLEEAFSPGGRWGDFPTGANIVHQLRVSAAYLAETEPANLSPDEVTPERGAELIGLDVSRLGSTLDPGIAESFGLLACLLMSRPDSGYRQLAKRELLAAIFLAAGAGAKRRAEFEAETGTRAAGEGEAGIFYPALNVAFDISRAEAREFVPSVPTSIQDLWREIAFEQARVFFGLPPSD